MATATEPRKTELVKQPSPFSAPIKFDVSMEQIKQLAAEYMPLAIIDVNDKAQVAKVHEARMDVTRLITGIEKGGKAMRDGFNKAAKEVITVERTLTDPLVKIRDHLKNEEGKVAREAERIAKEAAEARQAMIRDRLQKLQACGKAYMPEDVANLPGDEFEALHAAELKAKQARDEQAAKEAAERERIAAEQKAEKERLEKVAAELEAKRQAAETRNKRAMARMELLSRTGFAHSYSGDELADMESAAWELVLDDARKDKAKRDRAAADEQARLDKQRQEQAAAQADIEAEQKRLADIETDRIHRELIAKAAAEAAERARVEAEEKQKRDAETARVKAVEEQRERDRIEELRPDREKISIFADEVERFEIPQLSDSAGDAHADIAKALAVAAKAIRTIGSKLK